MLKLKNKIFTYSILICIIFIIFTILTYLNNISKSRLLNIDTLDTFSKISNEFIYFGRPTCIKCEKFQPLLEEILLEENLKVYYFNTDYFRENSLMTEEDLQELFKKYSITEIPSIIKLDYYGNLESLFTVDTFNDKEYIKNKIREYLLFKEFPEKFIPHYVLIIILFILTIIIILLKLILKNKKLLNKIILFLNVIIIISVIICVKLSMRYLDLHSLSGNSTIFYLYILIIILNLLSTVISMYSLIKNKKVL